MSWPTRAVWLLVAVFVALSLPIGPHRDDVSILSALGGMSWGDVWISPFKEQFYRPLTASIAKLSLALFGPTVLPLRLLQGGLIAATMALFARAAEEASDEARAASMVCLLASPMTFISMTPFAVGISDTLVAICFLACVVAERRGVRFFMSALALTTVAVLAKESGILVAVFAGVALARRKRFAEAGGMVVWAALYVAVRSAMVASKPFVFGTGFFGAFLTPEQLSARFAGSVETLYAYNVLANASSVLVFIPERGQFRITALTLLMVPVFVATTAVWVRGARLPLLATAVANACLGYAYVRTRVMFVAYVAIALMLAPAYDGLRERRRSLALALAVAWTLVLATSVWRLRVQAG